ncbi:enoyl-CoA hydratase [Moritella marina ATCC 15381]|uniref:Enoyl-CoA hydratase n=1 Tax=Moritella marina ATCC 15381 TaxID=1202962 RepID=A0A5J6WIY0_MORMI|nr:enoyl-CoA hydratase-related protein [Moritella marina]QFI37983.1 enoyl-CoA hydratase [Moritella marina ATCC 15381]
MDDFITSVVQGHILTLTINRPKARNALNQAMYLSLAQGLEQAQQDEFIRVVLIKATNDIFCAGNDMQDFQAMSEGKPDQHGARFMRALINCDKPIVAAVNGPAIGVGTTLLQFVDFLYLSPKAMFQTPFIAMGLCPELGSSELLAQHIGIRKAKAMLLAGERMLADEAVTLGFANQVCESADDTATAKAESLAKLAPIAMRTSKAMLMKASRPKLLALIEYENKNLAHLVTQPESREAVNAFMEKRQPDFSCC